MLNIFLIESKRQWLMMLRYPIESLAGVLIFTILFIGLFVGSKFLAGAHANFGNRLDLVVSGYIIWLVTTGLYAGPGAQLLDDAHSGILEQLFVSPHNFSLFSSVRVFSGLVQHLLLIAILVVVISLITGTRLDYRWSELIPFAGVILATSGVGLVVAAYALLVKQVGAILSIGQFLLIALVATPIQNFGPFGIWFSVLLPINYPSQVLQQMLANHSDATLLQLAGSIGISVFYFALGALVLELAAKRARQKASIGEF
jgi:ABC-2 type transport system permease protein